MEYQERLNWNVTRGIRSVETLEVCYGNYVDGNSVGRGF